MTEAELTKEERAVPFDQPIKIGLLLFHFIGFSGWYGAILIGVEVPFIFPVVTIISGVLLVTRELYKDGLVWLIMTEGLLTIAKIVLLILLGVLMEYEVIFLSIVMLCGILSSHLPERVRESKIV
jgi:hypothetical protein